jgi:DNA-binding MarR family transcriptional regulator
MSRLETEYADADDSPGLMLWRVTNAWQAAQRAALKPYDLTHVQFVLLASLTWLAGAGSGEPVTQRRLAQHAGTDPMMTSQVLRALEAKSLVTREPHPTDARARALAATPDGVALVNRAIGAVESVDRDFFAALGGRRVEFTQLLGTLL